ncbi:hypothetical protein B0J18DRAFT_252922 [Chaetomium sp. MPI-SDFR-AT-0129]|nr:hypothetical protein B0J18DRAFT_252922 [Chaetomium sp. MPI-SDFR-AT-0129]
MLSPLSSMIDTLQTEIRVHGFNVQTFSARAAWTPLSRPTQCAAARFVPRTSCSKTRLRAAATPNWPKQMATDSALATFGNTTVACRFGHRIANRLPAVRCWPWARSGLLIRTASAPVSFSEHLRGGINPEHQCVRLPYNKLSEHNRRPAVACRHHPGQRETPRAVGSGHPRLRSRQNCGRARKGWSRMAAIVFLVALSRLAASTRGWYLRHASQPKSIARAKDDWPLLNCLRGWRECFIRSGPPSVLRVMI